MNDLSHAIENLVKEQIKDEVAKVSALEKENNELRTKLMNITSRAEALEKIRIQNRRDQSVYFKNIIRSIRSFAAIEIYTMLSHSYDNFISPKLQEEPSSVREFSQLYINSDLDIIAVVRDTDEEILINDLSDLEIIQLYFNISDESAPAIMNADNAIAKLINDQWEIRRQVYIRDGISLSKIKEWFKNFVYILREHNVDDERIVLSVGKNLKLFTSLYVQNATPYDVALNEISEDDD